jgi:hypothetical protein
MTISTIVNEKTSYAIHKIQNHNFDTSIDVDFIPDIIKNLMLKKEKWNEEIVMLTKET